MIEKKAIELFVKPYYEDKDIMHDFSHIERVLLYVDKILNAGKYEVEKDILTLATYLHGFIYREESQIESWLLGKGIPKEKVEKTIQVAWESQKDHIPKTLEGKVLHDAHMIEGGKTYLVVKSLITGSVRGQTLEETISYIENNIIGKGECYLSEGISLYEEQQKYVADFINDLKQGLR